MKDSEKAKSNQDGIRFAVTGSLDKQASNIDPDISDRLDAARLKALAEPSLQSKSGPKLRQWSPIFGVCTALLVVVVMFDRPNLNNKTLISNNDENDALELVLTNQDMELMEEELEFYLWLAAQNS